MPSEQVLLELWCQRVSLARTCPTVAEVERLARRCMADPTSSFAKMIEREARRIERLNRGGRRGD